MTEEKIPPAFNSGSAGSSSQIRNTDGTVMSTGTIRTVRPSLITKTRIRASVVGGDHSLTREDIHNIFKRNTQDVDIISDEQIARVQLMHEKFTEASVFSFNYNTMLFVASILAGLGLASNSVATIVASMLVSPIMGPVMGMVSKFMLTHSHYP
jgi:hypothetical protein